MFKKRLSYKRTIRSYVIRKRKITTDQTNILNKFWNYSGINFLTKKININNLFDFNNSLIVDIGFGYGNALVDIASKNFSKNFLGIEVYLPGIIYCLKQINSLNIKNLKLIYYDAFDVLYYMIKDNSILKFQIFCPDVWSKRRHNKRRMLKKDFIDLIFAKLIFKGILHIITDSESYVNNILKIVSKITSFKNISHKKHHLLFNCREKTKFELKSKLNGKKLFNLVFEKN
ncbi:tRNA (guanosine(46)-N7)-methyltransferase TrmB [Buchnera aphidicola (Neophyllaphis varicolor)]|uniref:tRNA (guanosine(46)-N7)-methyltransferase TrmB n=1 Tax=Buchnera aphidicola TaxID=9 RepID=UPI0031B85892